MWLGHICHDNLAAVKIFHIMWNIRYENTTWLLMTLPADLLNPSSTSFLLKSALYLTLYWSLLTVLFNVVQEATVGELSEYGLINIFLSHFPSSPLMLNLSTCAPTIPNHRLINIHLLGAPTCLMVWSLWGRSLIGQGKNERLSC